MDFKWYDSELIKKIKEKVGQDVPADKLFNPMFMKSFTKSSNFDEFVLKSGFTLKEFKLKPNKDLDKYIGENTKFSSWQDMLNKAGAEYSVKKYKSKGM